MTIPGRVHVRVLPPVHSSAAGTREEMSQLLRTKMLEAIIDSPDNHQRERDLSRQDYCSLERRWNALLCLKHLGYILLLQDSRIISRFLDKIFPR